MTCKGCGKPVVWAKNEDGKTIPLDPRAPVYHLTRDVTSGGFEYLATRSTRQMVSHFATCPKANRFSGAKEDRDRREVLEKVAKAARRLTESNLELDFTQEERLELQELERLLADLMKTLDT